MIETTTIATKLSTRFTEITSYYINNGWLVNLGTMAGSQGEIAKVDFTKDNNTIRVLFKKEYRNFTDFYTIRVLGYKGQGFEIDDLATLWNERGEVLLDEWYMIKTNDEFNAIDVILIGSKEDVDAMRRKQRQRFENRYKDHETILDSKYYDTIAHFIRKCNVTGFKRVKGIDISSLCLIAKGDNGRKYFVSFDNGKTINFTIATSGYVYVN